MKIVRNTIYGLFLVLIFGVMALFLAPSIPFLGHLDVKIVKSGSMEPSIKTGGIVVVSEADFYNVGEVITFTSQGADIPTTHRILEKEQIDGVTQIRTKGDANEEADSELITESAIKGKVLFTVPYVGFVLDFARQPIGFALLIVLPGLLIVFDELEKIWREYRRLRMPKKAETDKISFMPLVIDRFVPTPTRGRMIDINNPVAIIATRKVEQVQQVSIHRTAVAPASRSRIPQSWVLAPCIVLAFSAFMVQMWSYGGTISYFSDVETALANVMGANALDFTATPENGTSFSFIDGILDNPDGLVALVAPEPESVPLKYALSVEFATGTKTFCDAIIAQATTLFAYSGPLLLLSASPVSFTGSWALGITLNPGTYLPGDTCVVDLVYKAWNATTNMGSGGYSDEERTQLTFTAPVLPLSAPIGAAGLRFASEIIDPLSDGATTSSDVVDAPTDTPDETISPVADTADTNGQDMTSADEDESVPQEEEGADSEIETNNAPEEGNITESDNNNSTVESEEEAQDEIEEDEQDEPAHESNDTGESDSETSD